MRWPALEGGALASAVVGGGAGSSLAAAQGEPSSRPTGRPTVMATFMPTAIEVRTQCVKPREGKALDAPGRIGFRESAVSTGAV